MLSFIFLIANKIKFLNLINQSISVFLKLKAISYLKNFRFEKQQCNFRNYFKPKNTFNNQIILEYFDLFEFI